jgi:hypothetical protein
LFSSKKGYEPTFNGPIKISFFEFEDRGCILVHIRKQKNIIKIKENTVVIFFMRSYYIKGWIMIRRIPVKKEVLI